MGDGVKQEVRSQGKHWAEKFIASHKHIDKRTCKQVSCSSHYSTSLKVNISGCLTDLNPVQKPGFYFFVACVEIINQKLIINNICAEWVMSYQIS